MSVTSNFEARKAEYYQELDRKIAAELTGKRLKYSVKEYRHEEPVVYSATCYGDALILFKWIKTTWKICHKQSNLEVAWVYSGSYFKDLTQPLAKRMIYRLLEAKLDWNFSKGDDMTASVRDNAPRIMAEVWNEELPPVTTPGQKQERPPMIDDQAEAEPAARPSQQSPRLERPAAPISRTHCQELKAINQGQISFNW